MNAADLTTDFDNEQPQCLVDISVQNRIVYTTLHRPKMEFTGSDL
jgi:hypothetical protein